MLETMEKDAAGMLDDKVTVDDLLRKLYSDDEVTEKEMEAVIEQAQTVVHVLTEAQEELAAAEVEMNLALRLDLKVAEGRRMCYRDERRSRQLDGKADKEE